MFGMTEDGVEERRESKLGKLTMVRCSGTHAGLVYEQGIVFFGSLGAGLPRCEKLLPLPPGRGPVLDIDPAGHSAVRDGSLWTCPSNESRWVHVFDIARAQS